MATWRGLISVAMKDNRESFDDVEYCTLTEEELDRKFDAGFGGSCGKPFTLWTKDHVYFPSVYDGYEEAKYVPRNPCDQATEHIGGE